MSLARSLSAVLVLVFTPPQSFHAFAQPAGPDSPVLSVDYAGISWTSVASVTDYDLIRGNLAVLRQSGGDFTAATRLCLADDSASPGIPYTGEPKSGEAFWFLVRANTPGVTGSYDSGGAGQAGSRDAEIEASPLTCFSPVLPHAPIAINGNAGFTSANGVVGGSGTAADPYLISGWDIVCPSMSSTRGVLISNTTLPFVVRNVRAQSCQLGILLSAARNGHIERFRAGNVVNGVAVSSCQDIAIEGCRSALQTGSGIAVSGTNIFIKGNRVENGMVGINLNGCSGCAVHQNEILSNVTQAIDSGGVVNPSAWDGGYPGGGNYWTNYQGVDLCRGPTQSDCSAPDGFGDTPLFVGTSRSDRYPRMSPDFAEGDDVPPTVAITSPSPGAAVTTDPFVVTGTAADTGSGIRRVELSHDGGPWMIASGTSFWSIEVTPHGGSNTVSVRSLDHAGQVSAISELTVSYEAPVWEAVLQTNKTAYAPGEPVSITFRLTNRTSHAVTLHFSTTCQESFRVENAAGATVYDQVAHDFCSFILTERTWQSNETVTYNFTWPQVNDSGQQVPAPADYRIVGYMDSSEEVPEGLATVSISP